jgi:thioredoxin-related protein
MRFVAAITIFALSMTGVSFPQSAVTAPSAADASAAANFHGLEQWKSAVNSGDAAALTALYSTTPKARVITQKGDIDAAADVKFWTDLKPHDVKAEVLQTTFPQPGTQQIVLAISLKSASHNDQTVYVNEGQLWQHEGEQWKLVAAKRTDVTRLQQPTSTTTDIYPAAADAHSEIKEALTKAAHEHKRVIVVFGANWCFDCHVLDKAFHRDDIAPLLNANFEVVHVDVGQGDKNQDLMKQYDVPMSKGIPALAVLDANGKLLFSQKDGQFESARSLGPADLVDFLSKWKPQAR